MYARGHALTVCALYKVRTAKAKGKRRLDFVVHHRQTRRRSAARRVKAHERGRGRANLSERQASHGRHINAIKSGEYWKMHCVTIKGPLINRQGKALLHALHYSLCYIATVLAVRSSQQRRRSRVSAVLCETSAQHRTRRRYACKGRLHSAPPSSNSLRREYKKYVILIGVMLNLINFPGEGNGRRGKSGRSSPATSPAHLGISRHASARLDSTRLISVHDLRDALVVAVATNKVSPDTSCRVPRAPAIQPGKEASTVS